MRLYVDIRVQSEKAKQETDDGNGGPGVADSEVFQVGTLVAVKNSAWVPAIVAGVHPGPKYDVEYKNGQVRAFTGRNCVLSGFL